MSKRTANLAQIQDYLIGASSAEANPSTRAPEDTGLPEGAEPHAAPGLKAEAGEKLHPGPDESLDEQEQKSALEQQTDRAAAKMRQVLNYSKIRLEALPMPGGLFLPIALLFVFFLALLPIGGHTRLSWLWQVITGNAELNQAEDVIPAGTTSGGPPLTSTTPTPTAPAPTTTPTPAILPAPTLPTAPFFTGVEEP